MKYCKFIQFQIINIGERKLVFSSKFIEIMIIGMIVYLISSLINVFGSFMFLKVNLTFDKIETILYFLFYQMTGAVRVLLYSLVAFLLVNKIRVALCSSLVVMLLEIVLYCLLIFGNQSIGTRSFYAKFLVYFSGATFGYSSVLLELTNPYLLCFIFAGEVGLLWILGKKIFEKKNFV